MGSEGWTPKRGLPETLIISTDGSPYVQFRGFTNIQIIKS
jgi:hypothetical protein